MPEVRDWKWAGIAGECEGARRQRRVEHAQARGARRRHHRAVRRSHARTIDAPGDVDDAIGTVRCRRSRCRSTRSGTASCTVAHGSSSAVVIDDAVERELVDLVPLAPLHQPPRLAAIDAARRVLPRSPPTSLASTPRSTRRCPPAASTYALPGRVARRVAAAPLRLPRPLARVRVTAGGRARGRARAELPIVSRAISARAHRCARSTRGRSVDTTMGFTPLEGTRDGDACRAASTPESSCGSSTRAGSLLAEVDDALEQPQRTARAVRHRRTCAGPRSRACGRRRGRDTRVRRLLPRAAPRARRR